MERHKAHCEGLGLDFICSPLAIGSGLLKKWGHAHKNRFWIVIISNFEN
jgi:hypothetical protein